jgi:hypothetical protein
MAFNSGSSSQEGEPAIILEDGHCSGLQQTDAAGSTTLCPTSHVQQLFLNDLVDAASKPIPIYQDNKSTMIMAIQGATFKRTKHLIGRHSYIRERLQNDEISLKYLPTADMAADILTKPVSYGVLERLKGKLHVMGSGNGW